MKFVQFICLIASVIRPTLVHPFDFKLLVKIHFLKPTRTIGQSRSHDFAFYSRQRHNYVLISIMHIFYVLKKMSASFAERCCETNCWENCIM